MWRTPDIVIAAAARLASVLAVRGRAGSARFRNDVAIGSSGRAWAVRCAGSPLLTLSERWNAAPGINGRPLERSGGRED